jgi:hypothetical protein
MPPWWDHRGTAGDRAGVCADRRSRVAPLLEAACPGGFACRAATNARATKTWLDAGQLLCSDQARGPTYILNSIVTVRRMLIAATGERLQRLRVAGLIRVTEAQNL